MATVIAVVLPVFGLILCGYVFARTGLIDARGTKGLATFVFCCAIPALLFRSAAGNPLPEHVSLAVSYTYFISCLIVFAFTMALSRVMFGIRLQGQALMAMNASFSNSVQLGIPLIFTAFGPAGELPVMLIISFHSMILITLATVIVELGRGRPGEMGRALASTAAAVATNPLIVAIAAGVACEFLGWRPAGPVDRFLGLLADAATPCALFTLGATLKGFSITGQWRESLVLVAIKLFVLPLVVWLLATKVFALTPIEVAVATIVGALPTGINAFILAQKYDAYVARSASTMVISTIVSVATLAMLLGHYVPAPLAVATP